MTFQHHESSPLPLPSGPSLPLSVYYLGRSQLDVFFFFFWLTDRPTDADLLNLRKHSLTPEHCHILGLFFFFFFLHSASPLRVGVDVLHQQSEVNTSSRVHLRRRCKRNWTVLALDKLLTNLDQLPDSSIKATAPEIEVKSLVCVTVCA